MNLTDDQRERIIDVCMIHSQHAETSEERHYWFNLMRAEIEKRSPERIAAMEKARGLRAA